MRKLLAVIPLILINTGCVNSKLDRVVAAMGKDPATVHVKISTIYGVVELARTNPRGDSLPHTVNPDGTISVAAQPVYVVTETGPKPAVVARTNAVNIVPTNTTNAPAK